MSFSPEQDAALLKVDRWLKAGEKQVCRLFGYAGTGKTTLARHFAENVDGTVLFGAFTGKAAYVLKQKGCIGASTIHSMIYHTKDKSRVRLLELERSMVELRERLVKELPEDASLDWVDNDPVVLELQVDIEKERKNLSRPMFQLNQDSAVREAALVVIDECSMVDARMGEDLLSFGVPVLVLGDPAQLPPVGGAGFFTDGVDPDIMLTEIHRQARDNPIIEMASLVRQGNKLPLGKFGDSIVVEKQDLDPGLPTKVGQILVGRNATRRASNIRIRELRGIPEALPIVGDKLVCLRNNHDKGLLNGSIWFVDDIGELSEDRLVMTVRSEMAEVEPALVEAHTHYFLGRDGDLPYWERKEAEEFDFGYAMTVHKAQGSQWDDVLLFDESWCFRQDRYKWLYTGLTRAANRVTVVKL